jgi:biotin transport system substrate-specific component
MTSMSLSVSRPRALTVVGVVGFAIALAAASQVAIPIPGTPVPLTLQPLVVMLAGLWLGPVAGAASMVLYLVAGMIGLPVFQPFGAPGMARLFGPTGGYLLAYPVAAALVGKIAFDAADYWDRFRAASWGMVMIYLGGIAQLAVYTGSLKSATLLGLLPFVLADFVKAAIAAAVPPRRL